jgi:hypothetical protein
VLPSRRGTLNPLHTYAARMDRATFDDYIRRFNERDASAFDDYIAPDMQMLNGGLRLTGAEGMKQHYAKIWSSFSEELHVERFVSDEETLAIRMWTHFTALRDDPDSTFGPVEKDETFDFRGLILYHLEDGLFTQIQVAYNSFTNTKVDGETVELGIPH